MTAPVFVTQLAFYIVLSTIVLASILALLHRKWLLELLPIFITSILVWAFTNNILYGILTFIGMSFIYMIVKVRGIELACTVEKKVKQCRKYVLFRKGEDH